MIELFSEIGQEIDFNVLLATLQDNLKKVSQASSCYSYYTESMRHKHLLIVLMQGISPSSLPAFVLHFKGLFFCFAFRYHLPIRVAIK